MSWIERGLSVLVPRDDSFIEDYRVKYPDIHRFYGMAKSSQCDVYRDIEWKAPLPFPEDKKPAVARVVSQFYWGEQAAHLVSGQMLALVNDQEARQALSMQVVDEARHVEAFQRYLERVDRVHPMTPYLRWLMRDILRSKSLEEKLLGMNLMVEGLALSGFRAFVQATGDPLAARMISLILRDESRHVGFAVRYIPRVFRNLSSLRKMRLMPTQIKWLWLIYESIRAHREDAGSFGFDVMGVVDDLLKEHQERVREIGIPFVLDPRRFSRFLH